MNVTKDNELELVEELRKNIVELVGDTLNKNEMDSAWRNNIDRLCQKILTSDPRDFLQWDVILRTMVVGNADFVREELNFLKDLPDWDSRWKRAIEESLVGSPTFYDDFSSSSGNLIHQAYHLAQFERITGIDIGHASFIFEFALTIHRLWRWLCPDGYAVRCSAESRNSEGEERGPRSTSVLL